MRFDGRRWTAGLFQEQALGIALDVSNETLKNNAFRRVLTITSQMELTVMALQPGEDIGEEVHPTTTQFLRVEQGQGEAVIDDAIYPLDGSGAAVIIPAGSEHNIKNVGKRPLKFYTIYCPSQHEEGQVDQVKP